MNKSKFLAASAATLATLAAGGAQAGSEAGFEGAASARKCFDKGALVYVPCPAPTVIAAPPVSPPAAGAPSFTGVSLAAAAGYAWGAAEIGLDWLNRYAPDMYGRTRPTIDDPWTPYTPNKSQRTIEKLLSHPDNQHAAALSPDVDLNGVLGEARVGYDHDFGQWVLGAAASFGVASVSGEEGVTLYEGAGETVPWPQDGFVNSTRSASIEIDSDWLASLIGRVGYKIDARTMVFGSAGLALQDFDVTITDERGNTAVSEQKTQLGYALGAGVERLVGDNVFVSVDYRFTDFQSFSVTGVNTFIEDGAALMKNGTKQWGHVSENSYSAKIDPHVHALRLTAGYRF